MRRRYIKAESESAKAYRAHYQARRENARAKKAQAKSELLESVKAACDAEDPMDALFHLLVPLSGPSDYYGGELVSAIMRILYRDWNDGDVFYEGYGIETCGDAVAFLCDELEDTYDAFANIAENQLQDEEYTNAIQAIANDYIVEFIRDYPERALEPNELSFLDYDGYEFIRENNWEPLYDISEDYPNNLLYHLEKEHIEERDIQWEVEEWVRDASRFSASDWTVHASDYYVEITELSRDAYDELERNLYTWLEQWGDDLDEEYGSADDEEYEEDEYDDEE